MLKERTESISDNFYQNLITLGTVWEKGIRSMQAAGPALYLSDITVGRHIRLQEFKKGGVDCRRISFVYCFYLWSWNIFEKDLVETS